MKAMTYTAALLLNIIPPIKDWIKFLSKKARDHQITPKVLNYIRKLYLYHVVLEVLFLVPHLMPLENSLSLKALSKHSGGHLKPYTYSFIPVSDSVTIRSVPAAQIYPSFTPHAPWPSKLHT